jgi:recombination protein RecA
VGLHARLMSQAMRKLTAVVAKSKTSLIFINQIREKIGVMFGSPETTTGGRALKFYTTMRLDIRRIGAIKTGDETIGNRTKLRVVKNKVAPPFRIAEFDILYGEGISHEGDLIELGVAHKVIDKTGSWYSYGDIRLGQGRENTRLFLRDNSDLAGEIEHKIRVVLELFQPGDNGAGKPAAVVDKTPASEGKKVKAAAPPATPRARAPEAPLG